MQDDGTPCASSPAMQFLGVLWIHQCEAVPHSWRTVNASMQRGLALAIEAGLRFALEDFQTISHTMRFGYWGGKDNDRNFGEHYYACACRAGNRSACLSFERWKGRKPFLVAGKRLYLGAELPWEGQPTIVTSFDDTAHALVACAYREVKRYTSGIQGLGPPSKRYTLTHAMLREVCGTKQRKEQRDDHLSPLRP